MGSAKEKLPPAFVRRVRRVLSSDDPHPLRTDENIDDLILLWRALERTFGQGESAAQKAREFVSEVCSTAGVGNLPNVRGLAAICRKFESAPDVVIDAWFLGPEFSGALASERSLWRARLARMAEAGVAPVTRWRVSDSKDVAAFLYRVRNGVMHGSLETTADLAARVIPAVRGALVDLCAAKAAMVRGVSIAQAFEFLRTEDEGDDV